MISPGQRILGLAGRADPKWRKNASVRLQECHLFICLLPACTQQYLSIPVGTDSEGAMTMRTDVKIWMAAGLVFVLVGVIYWAAKKPANTESPEVTQNDSPANNADYVKVPPPAVKPAAPLSPASAPVPSPIPVPPPTSLPSLPASPLPVPTPPAGPISPSAEVVSPLPSPAKAANQEYVVGKGDTLYAIAAKKYNDGNKYNLIVVANPGINPNVLVEGTKLVIPPLPQAPVPAGPVSGMPAGLPSSGGSEGYVVQSGDSFWLIAEKRLGNGKYYGLIQSVNPGVTTLRVGQRLVIPPMPAAGGAGATSQPARSTVAGAQPYTVVAGDSLYTIAEKVYGDGKHWPNIVAANPEVKNGVVREGQVLTIVPLTTSGGRVAATTAPAGAGTSSAAAPAKPARTTPKPAAAAPSARPDFGP
jgi:nucleoid-associated protein YgaU